jgi:triacylglycerol lipase
MTPKPLPTPDVRFVFHPETDSTYEHFGPGMPSFDGHAQRLGRLHAWWLAEAALLAYWGPTTAIPRFRAAGFEAVFLEAGALQCYVASTNQAVIVTFRGTEPDEWGDVLDDALYAMAPWIHAGTHVHLGFKAALDRVWDSLAGVVEPLARSRRVWFTGHSLGAALATLAADRFASTTGVCTLGSPRVGDRAFARRFDERFGARAARYVNDTDIITHVPPRLTFPYKHVGGAHYIDADGRVSTIRPQLAHYVADLFGRARPIFEIAHGLEQGHLKTAPDFLLDHMPRSYAVALCNDYALNGD